MIDCMPIHLDLRTMAPLKKISLKDLNKDIVCSLCFGYLIEATAISECLHTFCKMCIVNYLTSNNYCPICDVLIHKTRPTHYLREDKIKQDIVYKLVPGLYRSEMARRVDFYKKHPEAGGDRTEKSLKERRHFFHVDDQISLSLDFLPPAHAHAHALGLRPLRAPPTKEPHGADDKDDDSKLPVRRYLQCPAAVPIRLLEKFIREKYRLTSEYRVDIVHGGDCLSPEMTLLDVVYHYKWTETEPLLLQYTVIDPPTPYRKRPRSVVAKKNKTLVVSPKKIKLENPEEGVTKKVFKGEIKKAEIDESKSVCKNVSSEKMETFEGKKELGKKENEEGHASPSSNCDSLNTSCDDGESDMVIDESQRTEESNDSSEKSLNEESRPSSGSAVENSSLSSTNSSIESLQALVNSSNYAPSKASPSYNNSASINTSISQGSNFVSAYDPNVVTNTAILTTVDTSILSSPVIYQHKTPISSVAPSSIASPSITSTPPQPKVVVPIVKKPPTPKPPTPSPALIKPKEILSPSVPSKPLMPKQLPSAKVPTSQPPVSASAPVQKQSQQQPQKQPQKQPQQQQPLKQQQQQQPLKQQQQQLPLKQQQQQLPLKQQQQQQLHQQQQLLQQQKLQQQQQRSSSPMTPPISTAPTGVPTMHPVSQQSHSRPSLQHYRPPIYENQRVNDPSTKPRLGRPPNHARVMARMCQPGGVTQPRGPRGSFPIPRQPIAAKMPLRGRPKNPINVNTKNVVNKPQGSPGPNSPHAMPITSMSPNQNSTKSSPSIHPLTNGLQTKEAKISKESAPIKTPLTSKTPATPKQSTALKPEEPRISMSSTVPRSESVQSVKYPQVPVKSPKMSVAATAHSASKLSSNGGQSTQTPKQPAKSPVRPKNTTNGTASIHNIAQTLANKKRQEQNTAEYSVLSPFLQTGLGSLPGQTGLESLPLQLAAAAQMQYFQRWQQQNYFNSMLANSEEAKKDNAAPMDLSPTSKGAPATVLSSSNKTNKATHTTTPKQHPKTKAKPTKLVSSKATSNSQKCTSNIAPPTSEVTITKLSGSNGSSANNDVTSSSTSPTTTTPLVAKSSNTVSITKRPSSTNASSNGGKLVSTMRSPSSAAVRQIPNPSLLSHQKNSASKQSPTVSSTASAVTQHQQILNNNNNINKKSVTS